MTSVGTIPIDCPVCGRHLHVPLNLEPATSASKGTRVGRLRLDRSYLEAHWLTHNQHDGEPLPTAA